MFRVLGVVVGLIAGLFVTVASGYGIDWLLNDGGVEMSSAYLETVTEMALFLVMMLGFSAVAYFPMLGYELGDAFDG